MVGKESPDISASVLWSIPSNARAAFIWKDVIMRPSTSTMINDASDNENDVKNIKWQWCQAEFAPSRIGRQAVSFVFTRDHVPVHPQQKSAVPEGRRMALEKPWKR
jgi:hypothetical protein